MSLGKTSEPIELPLISRDSKRFESFDKGIKSSERSSIADIVRRTSLVVLKSRVGIFYQLLSSFCIVMMFFMRKQVSFIPAAQAVLYRTPFTLSAILAFFYYQGKMDDLKRSFVPKLTLLGCSASISALSGFTAIVYIPVGDQTIILSATAIVNGILAAIILKEKYLPREKLLGAISFLGVFLVVRPPFIFGSDKEMPAVEGGMSRAAAACLVLVPMFFDSCNAIIVRSLGAKFHAFCTPFHINFVMAVAFGFYYLTIGTLVPVSFRDIIIIFLFGGFNLTGLFFWAKALENEKPSVVGLAGYSQPIYSLIIDVIIFGIYPPFLTIMGAILILGSCIYLVISKNS